MKALTFLSLLSLSIISVTISATPAYVARSNDALAQLLPSAADPGLPEAPPSNIQCLACHRSSGPPMVGIGSNLVSAAIARGYGPGNSNSWSSQSDPSSTVFRNIYQDILDIDSDGDSVSNRDEFIARTNPSDPTSVPSGVTPIQSDSPPQPVVENLAPRSAEGPNTQNSNNLSGCGNVAGLSSPNIPHIFEASSFSFMELQLILFLFLPLLFWLVLFKKEPNLCRVKKNTQDRRLPPRKNKT